MLPKRKSKPVTEGQLDTLGSQELPIRPSSNAGPLVHDSQLDYVERVPTSGIELANVMSGKLADVEDAVVPVLYSKLLDLIGSVRNASGLTGERDGEMKIEETLRAIVKRMINEAEDEETKPLDDPADKPGNDRFKNVRKPPPAPKNPLPPLPPKPKTEPVKDISMYAQKQRPAKEKWKERQLTKAEKRKKDLEDLRARLGNIDDKEEISPEQLADLTPEELEMLSKIEKKYQPRKSKEDEPIKRARETRFAHEDENTFTHQQIADIFGKEWGVGTNTGIKAIESDALRKARYLLSVPEQEVEYVIVDAMNDYLEYGINDEKYGYDLTPDELKFLTDNPEALMELDGFRDFLSKYIVHGMRSAQRKGLWTPDERGGAKSISGEKVPDEDKPAEKKSPWKKKPEEKKD